ncbi:class I SAM-dependent methyltransferase [Embleya sp. NPDC020886]|uniref:class I SAM-dependent methyltransferase n=1 Tax=Embleya sp. NPDC020886 TaxID=3363980 RepID=UPI0037A8E400
MPFDHNDHYHPLLLRQVPRNSRTALDVGCGTGRFARRLAASGIAVDAIDPAEEAIAEARRPTRATPSAPRPRFRCADVTEIELPAGHYDFISCLASIHHVPFDTVAGLRDALAPGGVLVILGCHPEHTPLDWAYSLAAVPINAAARLVVAAKERRGGRAGAPEPATTAPVRPPTMPLPLIRREAAALLPGCTVRRLLFWRYLLVYRARG